MRIKFIWILFLCTTLSAQSVWENSNSEIYPYLNRLSQKGLIDFQDIIRPVSRQKIANLLLELDSKKDQLSKTEKAELSSEIAKLKEDSINMKAKLLKKAKEMEETV